MCDGHTSFLVDFLLKCAQLMDFPCVSDNIACLIDKNSMRNPSMRFAKIDVNETLHLHAISHEKHNFVAFHFISIDIN